MVFVLDRKLIGVCSLLTSMRLLGSSPVFEVGSAIWPDCPSNSEVAHGAGLISASVAGEGVQVGGGVEQKEEVWIAQE